MLELDGDTTRLMAASEEIGRLISTPEGLLVRIAAPTDDGMVLFQLWETAEARQRNAENPAHAEAMEASGMRGLVRGSRSRVFDRASLRHVAEGQGA